MHIPSFSRKLLVALHICAPFASAIIVAADASTSTRAHATAETAAQTEQADQAAASGALALARTAHRAPVGSASHANTLWRSRMAAYSGSGPANDNDSAGLWSGTIITGDHFAGDPTNRPQFGVKAGNSSLNDIFARMTGVASGSFAPRGHALSDKAFPVIGALSRITSPYYAPGDQGVNPDDSKSAEPDVTTPPKSAVPDTTLTGNSILPEVTAPGDSIAPDAMPLVKAAEPDATFPGNFVAPDALFPASGLGTPDVSTLNSDDLEMLRVDDPRLGTAWADVGTVPEPSSMMLSVLGVCMLMTYRRRRQG